MAYVRKKFSRKVYKPKGTSLKRVAKKAIRKYKRKGVIKIVKKVLDREAETKIVIDSFTFNPTSLQSGTNSLAGNYWVLNPSNATFGYTIARGTANNQMEGNKIRLKSCSLKVVIYPTPYNATTNPFTTPMLLRAYVFRSKNLPHADLSANDFNNNGNFFENGSSYVGFSGNVMDMNRRINKENYVYLGHRTFKLGNAIPSTSATTTANYSTSNNDFRLSYNFTWYITKYLPKVQNMNDSNVWQNPYVFILWQPVPAVSAVGNFAVNSTLPVTIQSQIEYKYKDF